MHQYGQIRLVYRQDDWDFDINYNLTFLIFMTWSENVLNFMDFKEI